MSKPARALQLALLCGAVAAGLLLWMPAPVADLALRGLMALGRQGSTIEDPQAIVVLGGRASRAKTAAALAKATGLPLYVAGRELVPELVRSGVQPTWSESVSIDTRSNASVAACLLLPRGVRKVLLVTDPLHMPRASRWFAHFGFEVARSPSALTLGDLPPGTRAAAARHELGGLVEFAFEQAAAEHPLRCEGAQQWLDRPLRGRVSRPGTLP